MICLVEGDVISRIFSHAAKHEPITACIISARVVFERIGAAVKSVVLADLAKGIGEGVAVNLFPTRIERISDSDFARDAQRVAVGNIEFDISVSEEILIVDCDCYLAISRFTHADIVCNRLAVLGREFGIQAADCER